MPSLTEDQANAQGLASQVLLEACGRDIVCRSKQGKTLGRFPTEPDDIPYKVDQWSSLHEELQFATRKRANSLKLGGLSRQYGFGEEATPVPNQSFESPEDDKNYHTFQSVLTADDVDFAEDLYRHDAHFEADVLESLTATDGLLANMRSIGKSEGGRTATNMDEGQVDSVTPSENTTQSEIKISAARPSVELQTAADQGTSEVHATVEPAKNLQEAAAGVDGLQGMPEEETSNHPWIGHAILSIWDRRTSETDGLFNKLDFSFKDLFLSAVENRSASDALVHLDACARQAIPDDKVWDKIISAIQLTDGYSTRLNQAVGGFDCPDFSRFFQALIIDYLQSLTCEIDATLSALRKSYVGTQKMAVVGTVTDATRPRPHKLSARPLANRNFTSPLRYSKNTCRVQGYAGDPVPLGAPDVDFIPSIAEGCQTDAPQVIPAQALPMHLLQAPSPSYVEQQPIQLGFDPTLYPYSGYPVWNPAVPSPPIVPFPTQWSGGNGNYYCHRKPVRCDERAPPPVYSRVPAPDNLPLSEYRERRLWERGAECVPETPPPMMEMRNKWFTSELKLSRNYRRHPPKRLTPWC